jgi:glucose-1-phosphate thymidylyltransferase
LRKGIILAGGSATRLRPVTEVVSKQLLPVYDKPLVYYPLTTLMLAGIRDFLIISTPNSIGLFRELLGDGEKFGIRISYESQDKPRGVAEALIIAQEYLAGQSSALILGDNLFHGPGLGRNLSSITSDPGATVMAYQVANPSDFGVVEFGEDGVVTNLTEKPAEPKTNWIVPGLYFYDESASARAQGLKPSSRGELEITDLNRSYLEDKKLTVQKLERGTSWFDMGTADSLLDAAEYVRMVQKRQGLLVGSPEEVAWRQGWISTVQVSNLARQYKSRYGSLVLASLESR